MASLGANYLDAGEIEKGVALLEETVRLSNTGLNPQHPVRLCAIHNLASAYCDLGRLEDALQLNEEVLQ
jgi:hypothetical protein